MLNPQAGIIISQPQCFFEVSTAPNLRPYVSPATNDLMADGQPEHGQTNKERFVSQSRPGGLDSSDPRTGDRHAPPDQRPAFSPHRRGTLIVAGDGAGRKRKASPYVHGAAARPATTAAPRWRCKACRADFSLTSSTLFAFHKLRIRSYLAATVIFVNEIKGKNAPG